MCNATHSRRDAARAASIARNCAECARGRGAGADFDDDPLRAVRRLARSATPGSASPPADESKEIQ